MGLETAEAGNDRRGRFFAYAPVFVWAAVILFLGSGAGSTAQTSRFIKPFIEFFFPDAPPDTFLVIHALIRKAAHFIEYGLLSILSARAFAGSSNAGLKNYWPLASMVVVTAVAAFDEIRQSFDVTRTGSGWDVALDVSGALFALLLFWLFRRWKGSPAVETPS